MGTCICLPTVAVQPVSAITVGSSSLKRALIASAAFDISSERCSGVVCDHAGNAVLGGARRVERLRGRRLRGDAHDLLGRRVDDVVAAVGTLDPLAADQKLALGHGREV